MALADQALFAGSNFILNIVLARWLSPNDYGAFGVAFSMLRESVGDRLDTIGPAAKNIDEVKGVLGLAAVAEG